MKVIAALFFLACSMPAVQPVTITIDDSFGVSRPRLQAIAQRISVIVAAKFDAPPPITYPIRCVSRTDVPETIVLPGQIIIFLSARDDYWAQFAFQLGHELGHVYLGPLRSNGFIEALATAVSLEVLDELAKTWATEPAVDGTPSWASNFSLYREGFEISEVAKYLPEMQGPVTSRDWLLVRLYLRFRSSDIADQLTRDSVVREEARALQTLAAMSLRSQPIDWHQFVNLAHSSSENSSIESSFLYVRTLPTAARDVRSLCRIGLGCPSGFLAVRFCKEPPKNSRGLVYYQDTWYAMEELMGNEIKDRVKHLCKNHACISFSATIQ